jgi:hypothetical protein
MMVKLANAVAMVVVAAHADTDADGGIGRRGAQQGDGEDGCYKGFHNNLLQREGFPTQ